MARKAWQAWRPLRVFLQGASLRRRVALSLALVRLILVPVIFLAIYYLFAMGWIVDRIVSVETPVATLAERASIEMMDARRAEQNYFLLHDPLDVEANRESLSQLERTITQARQLQPEERSTTEAMLRQLNFYRGRFQQAVQRAGEAQQAPVESLRRAVRAYQKDLDELLKRAPQESRAQLIGELRNRIGSFDAEIAATVQAEDPQSRQTSQDLRTASQRIIRLADDLEKRSWERVQHDHAEARLLIRRAEWVLSIVSALTLLLSVWVSFTLPRQVVKPLADLKEAVDHAAAGNYEIESEVQGAGEVVQLANSVRNLIAHLREKRQNSGPLTKS
jgi:nitrogen fixation/metabolism regulation signal transduction histidine kinase